MLKKKITDIYVHRLLKVTMQLTCNFSDKKLHSFTI